MYTGKKRRFAAVLTFAAVMFGFCPALFGVSAAALDIPFADVPQNHPYYEGIVYCYQNDIIGGMTPTRFEPDGILTRADVVTLMGHVARNMKLKTDGYSTSFQDVPKDVWYETYVGWAASNKIVNGRSPARFAPLDQITREEAAMLIVQFAEKLGFQLDASETVAFSDQDEISDWAQAPLERAIAAGLVIGAGEGLLRPQAKITRAETVHLIYSLCNRYIGDTKLYYLYGEYIKADPQLPLNNYIAENFLIDGSFRSYQDGATASMQGVDVSSHQGAIDWEKASAAGVTFAMIRVGGRGYGEATGNIFADTEFQNNVEGALANGVKVGVYFFSQAVSVEEALEEAQYVLSEIEGYDISFPVVYDWENIADAPARTDKASAKTVTDCAVAFCGAVAEEGYIPMVYFNVNIAIRHYEIGGLAGLDFWLAEYREIPEFIYEFKIWQYTDRGRVDGIPGNVDMDISLIDYSVR